MQKISIYSSFTSKIPIEERIASIKEAGFDAVCLDFEKNLEKTETSWINQLCLAEKYDLPVENVHLTGCGMSSVWEKGDKGDAVTDRLIQELRDMASLGIKIGVAHVTWGHARPAENLRIGLRRYEKAAEVAEKFGVKLALENSVYPEYVRFLLDNLKSPAIGFCYDSGHENAFSKGENYLDDYAERLFAMHLHDNDGISDQHGVPMTGQIDWKHTVSQLRRSTLFEHTLTLECVLSSSNISEELYNACQVGRKLAAL